MENKLLAIVAVGMLAGPLAANAALVSIDYAAAGDGLITRDTASGLEWLDFTATVGLTFGDFEAGSGGWSAAFRLATRDEVLTLLNNAGLPNENSFSPDTLSAARAFNDLFNSANTSCPTPESASSSAFSSCARWRSPTGTLDTLNVGSTLEGGSARAYVFEGLDPGLGEALRPFYGFALVRDSSVTVPEPASLVLFGLGLAGLGFARRHERK